jgi:uncharacterized protein YdeI (YjbR/CyaY-like superfamily)
MFIFRSRHAKFALYLSNSNSNCDTISLSFSQSIQGRQFVTKLSSRIEMSRGDKKSELQEVEVQRRQEWRDWLTNNHEQSESIWLVTHKKHTGNDKYLAYNDIVEEALCFGWIDSLARKHSSDENRTMRLLSPRQPKSVWSRLNKSRVARLESQQLIMPAGMSKIEQAKADGSWSFLDDVEALIVPHDLAIAFSTANPQAKAFFEEFSPSTKKGILQWIKMAKREQTRQQRIEKTVALAAQNMKAR